jgi:hypothetical protein
MIHNKYNAASGCKTTPVQLYSISNYKVYNTLLQGSDILKSIINTHYTVGITQVH